MGYRKGKIGECHIGILRKKGSKYSIIISAKISKCAYTEYFDLRSIQVET